MSHSDDLRAEISRARSGLRQAVEYVGSNWERARAPRPHEDEVWSPRQAAEHALQSDLRLAIGVARALQQPRAEICAGDSHDAGGMWLPDVETALRALDGVALLTNTVYASVNDDDLARLATLESTIGGVMTFAAWHLLDHARQVAGVEQG